MAVENYPASLPKVLLATYSNIEKEHFRRNDVETGPPRYELLTSITPAFFQVKWNFNALDFQAFEGWFKLSLSFGVVPFLITLPVGKGDIDHECNFQDSYTVNRIGKRVLVSASLIAVEKQYNSDTAINDLLLLLTMTSEEDKTSFFNAFIDFAEVTLPDEWETINYGTDFS